MNLKNLQKRHREELEILRKTCQHHKKDIKIYKDHSVVGCGSGYPSIHIICKNCGTKKIIFRRTQTEFTKSIIPKLTKQGGFEDEILDLVVTYDWEIED